MPRPNYKSDMARHLSCRNVASHAGDRTVYKVKVLACITADIANAVTSGTFVSIDGESNVALPMPGKAEQQDAIVGVQEAIARLEADKTRLLQRLARLEADNAQLLQRLDAQSRQIRNLQVAQARQTLLSASYALIGLLVPHSREVAKHVRALADMSVKEFSRRLPKGLVADPEDYSLVHEQFKQLVAFTIGKDSACAIHSKNWREFNEEHGDAIWLLKDTTAWREGPWESVTAILTRATEFARLCTVCKVVYRGSSVLS